MRAASRFGFLTDALARQFDVPVRMSNGHLSCLLTDYGSPWTMARAIAGFPTTQDSESILQDNVGRRGPATCPQ